MAVSHSQCLQLCELAGRQQRLLAVYQNRRCAAAGLRYQPALFASKMGK